MSPIISPTKTSTGTPPPDERPPELREAADSGGDILVPHILIQLEDDLERAHRREAAIISIAVHIFAVIFLLLSPKIFGFKSVVLVSPDDIMRNKQLTYLDLPPTSRRLPSWYGLTPSSPTRTASPRAAIPPSTRRRLRSCARPGLRIRQGHRRSPRSRRRLRPMASRLRRNPRSRRRTFRRCRIPSSPYLSRRNRTSPISAV